MKRFKMNFLFSFFLILMMAAANVRAAEEQRRQITLPPSIPKIEKPPAASLPQPVPQVPKVWDTSVAETQRQLEDILRIHQILQAQQYTQLQEIQRITEQAELHRKILNELKTTRQVAGAGGGGVGRAVEEAIRVQKIALIQEEARKNRLRLRKLQRKAAREKKLKGILEEKAPTPPTAPPAKKSSWEELFKAFSAEKLPFSSQKSKEEK